MNAVVAAAAPTTPSAVLGAYTVSPAKSSRPGIAMMDVTYSTSATGARRAEEIGAARLKVIADRIASGAFRVEVVFARPGAFRVLEWTSAEAVVRDYGEDGLNWISTEVPRVS